MRRPTINLDHFLRQQPTWKGRKKQLLLFVYLSSLLQASSSILILGHSFTGVRTYIFRIPKQTEDQQLSRTTLGLQHQIKTADSSSLVDGATAGFLAFPSWDSHCWPTHTTACKPTILNPIFILSALFFQRHLILSPLIYFPDKVEVMFKKISTFTTCMPSSLTSCCKMSNSTPFLQWPLTINFTTNH